MKKIFFTMMILILGSAYLYADEIYLKDNSIIKCRIIRVAANVIKYDPEGDVTREAIKKSKVAKIVYDTGEQVVFDEEALKKLNDYKNQYGSFTKKSNVREPIVYDDKIYLKDKSIIKCKIISENVKTIQYDPEGKDRFDAIDKSKVVKIVYNNGKQVIFDEESLKKIKNLNGVIENAGVTIEESDEKKTISERSYKDYFFKIGLVGAMGFYGGSIYNKEERIEHENGGHSGIGSRGGLKCGGIEFDLMLPTDVKFGIKSRFLMISDDQEESDYKSDDLFSYTTWQIGPVVHTVIHENDFGAIVFQCYALYGRIDDGTLRAMNNLRASGMVIDKSEYHRTFDGYTVSAGIGSYYVFKKAAGVCAGINLNYTFAKFKFDKKIPAYKSDHTSYKSINFEFVAGVAF